MIRESERHEDPQRKKQIELMYTSGSASRMGFEPTKAVFEQ